MDTKTALHYWNIYTYTLTLESGDNVKIIDEEDFIKSMEEYASPLKKRIEELQAALGDAIVFLDKDEYGYVVNDLKKLLHPSTNGKQDDKGV